MFTQLFASFLFFLFSLVVPAYFNDAQRQATKDAGTVAGLNVLRILNEPTAASLAYGQKVDPLPIRNILIFDLGGGTFDLSVLTIRDGLEFEVRSTAGDTHLGGQDFDDVLVKHFVELFHKNTGHDVRNDPRAMSRLKTAAERAKHNLSFSSEVDVEVDVFFEGIDFHTRLSRARFEDLCASLFVQIFEPVRQAIEDFGLSREHIDDVVLVGGSTRIPKIQSMLRSYFRDKPLSLHINPDEAVAIGAAIQVAMLIKDDSWVMRYLVLKDVAPLSLGIGLEDGGVKTIIARNTLIPCVCSGALKTFIDNQTAVLFEVYEGERPLARDNILLGSYVIDDIPLGPRGAVKFETVFSIDEDGILTVSSRERQTGKSQQITIGGNEHRWTRTEVHSMLREAQNFRKTDEALKRRLHSRRALENKAYEIKRAAASPVAAMSIRQLQDVQRLYQAELDWLDADWDKLVQPGVPTDLEVHYAGKRLTLLRSMYCPYAAILDKAGYVDDSGGTDDVDQTVTHGASKHFVTFPDSPWHKEKNENTFHLPIHPKPPQPKPRKSVN